LGLLHKVMRAAYYFSGILETSCETNYLDDWLWDQRKSR
jgi:hypothetical protein